MNYKAANTLVTLSPWYYLKLTTPSNPLLLSVNKDLYLHGSTVYISIYSLQ